MNKASKLRQMLEGPGAVIAPGVYDALGARIVQDVGFQAVYMTGNGAMASLLGKPDLALATMTEMVMRAHQIAACVEIPLICDADTGYGGLGNVRRTVEELVEDQVVQKRCGALGGLKLVSEREACSRIEVAAAAKRNPDFTIIARTDAREVYGLNEAIRRVRLYREAGADMLMVEGLKSLEEIRRTVEETDAPVLFNIYESSREEAYSVRDLEAAGVKLIINCLTSTLYNAANMKRLFMDFKASGSTAAYVDKMMPMSEYTRILGIEEEAALSEKQPSE